MNKHFGTTKRSRRKNSRAARKTLKSLRYPSRELSNFRAATTFLQFVAT
jgi:hypothetical protein